jgi:predicted metal-dependent enzyme (double-stranded beta helix superfamily)
MDFIVDNLGCCSSLLTQAFIFDGRYRLYRFLTDVEDILQKDQPDRDHLIEISPLVRRLLEDCLWLQVPDIQPDRDLGWGVQTIYDEPFFDLTVQLVTWLPGTKSTIHNHGGWGIVALLDGMERNQFWYEKNDRLVSTGEQILKPGEMICFLPQAVHQIEALGEQPTISFNLYGKSTDRFEYDLQNNNKRPY